jgi:hypothetical protein
MSLIFLSWKNILRINVFFFFFHIYMLYFIIIIIILLLFWHLFFSFGVIEIGNNLMGDLVRHKNMSKTT